MAHSRSLVTSIFKYVDVDSVSVCPNASEMTGMGTLLSSNALARLCLNA